MRGTLRLALALAALGYVLTYPASVAVSTTGAIKCFYTGEKTSAFLRICYYDCLGDEAAITIKSTQLCPLSITR